MHKVTVGNFFSGSGTWELATKLCGATPIWESEIEPFPIELEAKRLLELDDELVWSKTHAGYGVAIVDKAESEE